MAALNALDMNPLRDSSAKIRLFQKQLPGDTKTGIALALGGGFSRGFAHLGVLEVLEQEDIPVSAIVGTSIGGLLGASYADGIPIQDLCELGSHVRLRDLIRFQTSGQAAKRTDLIGEFVHERFHASQVEDLSIPIAIVATDLATCAPHIFKRGPLEIAIRASCAFPGLFKPVEHEGRLLADGCIVTPVPTAAAARMGASLVLGVALGSNSQSASSPDWAGRNHTGSSWIRHADIILQPEVRHIDWKDFSHVYEAHALGAEAMRSALPRLRELLAYGTQLRPSAGKTCIEETRQAS